jgi:hypothetical protein
LDTTRLQRLGELHEVDGKLSPKNGDDTWSQNGLQ